MYGTECNCGCIDSHKKKLNGDSSKIIKPKNNKPKQNEIFTKTKSKNKKK